MKHILIPALATLLLAACASPAPTVPPVDVSAIQTSAVKAVLETAQASAPTAVPLSPTLITPSLEPTSTNSENVFAWNYLAKQDSGGLQIEIARFVLANQSSLPLDLTLGGTVTVFDDRPVVGEIVFKIINSTADKIISVYPDQGQVIGGGEQIDLYEFALYGEFGDRFSGEIHPGVTVIGGIWFGFKRTPIDQIQSVTIAINPPSDQGFNILGPAFNIVLDLTDRQNQPLPDELSFIKK